MSKKYTQAHRVFDYIKNFGSITRAEALSNLGVANLPAVIEELRHKHGYDIVTNEVKAKNRWGESITYARYSFSEEKSDGETSY